MFAGAEQLITTNKNLFSLKNSTSKKDEAALTLKTPWSITRRISIRLEQKAEKRMVFVATLCCQLKCLSKLT